MLIESPTCFSLERMLSELLLFDSNSTQAYKLLTGQVLFVYSAFLRIRRVLLSKSKLMQLALTLIPVTQSILGGYVLHEAEVALSPILSVTLKS